MPSPMLATMIEHEQEDNTITIPNTASNKNSHDCKAGCHEHDSNTTKIGTGEADKEPEDLYAATKGGKAKGSKGYGQCWECGEWGHP